MQNPTPRFILLLCAVVFGTTLSIAQDFKDIKFGKVKPEDFELPKGKLTDSSAAVIINDMGETVFRGNTDGGFSIEFTRKMRARINTAAGVDLADFQIPLYGATLSDREVLLVKAAVAYNLENGQVVATEMNKKQIFQEKLSDKLYLSKFSIPGVKPGSLIEVHYTVLSKYVFNLQPWSFQGGYPRLWSSYEVGIPEFFNYAFLAQGYLPFHEKTQKVTRENYNLSNSGSSAGDRSSHFSVTANVNNAKWVVKDAPALKEEPFTTSVDNHISQIEFQLSEVRYPNEPIRPVMGTWSELKTKMLESEDFGANIFKGNAFVDDELKLARTADTSAVARATAIYNYVRDHYTCTQASGLYMQQSLKETIKKKSGRVPEINLLLVSMLNRAGIPAYPVILSTRSNGLTNSLYPLIDRFDYVACAVDVTNTGDVSFCDATDPQMVFGKLPLKCYNGHARIITPQDAVAIDLKPDQIKESKITMLIATLDSGKWTAQVNSTLGYYESIDVQSNYRKSGKQSVYEEVEKSYPDHLEKTVVAVDHMDTTGKQVVSHIILDYTAMLEDDIIYLNPLPGGVIKDNPFNASERYYPVELPYIFDETYVATWSIPEGFAVDDMPKSTRVKLFENSGMFEYLSQVSADKIMLRCRLKIDQAFFAPEDYQQLKEFFDYVINKENEQIVLKRKAKP